MPHCHHLVLLLSCSVFLLLCAAEPADPSMADQADAPVLAPAVELPASEPAVPADPPADPATDTAADDGHTDEPTDEDERVDEDVITLTNGHMITGTLVTSTDQEAVYLQTGHGLIALDRALIDEVTPSFATRLAQLDENDYEGALALARWAHLHQRSGDALALLRRFEGSARLDLDGLGLLARLIDLEEGPLVALPYYQRYVADGGQDPLLQQRLAVLQAAKEQYDEQLQRVRELREAHAVAEGLEIKEGWKSELPEYANPMAGTVEVIPGGSKNQGLKLTFEGGEKYKATLGRSHRLDIRNTPVMVMDVFNPTDTPLPFSIAVKCGDNWDYYESPATTVPADNSWHKLSFNLLEPNFKCKKDGFKRHSYRLAHPESIRETQFQVHNGSRDGHLWIDNLGYLPAP